MACLKCLTYSVVVVAVFIGLTLSGFLQPLYNMLDGIDSGRGQMMKGMIPLFHEGIPYRFNLEDIPDLQGKTILVTGGNVGLGYWTAHHLAAHKAHVLLACRNSKKCAAAADKIESETNTPVETVALDLSSFASIRTAAASLAVKHPEIDSLVLNAGVMMPPFRKTKEGLELQIGVNHFGHFLLTKLLLPQVEAAAKANGAATVVSVSSNMHYQSYKEGILASIDHMNDESIYSREDAYGQSKLANVLFAQELSERVKNKNILVNSLNPGFVATDLARHVLGRVSSVSTVLADILSKILFSMAWHPRVASLTQIFAAVGPELLEKKITGKFFQPIARETVVDPHARGEAGVRNQKRLWKMTEDFIASHP